MSFVIYATWQIVKNVEGKKQRCGRVARQKRENLDVGIVIEMIYWEVIGNP